MFEVDKKLKAILEGATDITPHRDFEDEGGMDDEMIMEAALAIFMAESDIVGDVFTESSLDGVPLVQLLREMTEEEIRDDIEKKRTRWQRFKEAFKRFLNSPFDPYGGLKELKLVNELIKDDTTAGIAAAIPFLGIGIVIYQRAKKYKNFPEATAREYIAEAQKQKKYLEKIYANLSKEEDKKYKKAARRVKGQINYIESWIREFDRRAIDKTLL